MTIEVPPGAGRLQGRIPRYRYAENDPGPDPPSSAHRPGSAVRKRTLTTRKIVLFAITLAVLFDKPGMVTLGCNIHDWMLGYINVTDSPWFGRTGEDGSAIIDDLPPGNYKVHVWHPRMVAQESSTEVDIRVTDTVAATPSWNLDPKPDLRRRRAPVMATGSHR